MLRHFLYSMHCFLVGLLCICIFSGCDNNTNNIKDLKILSVELANDLSQDILINTNASLINNTTTFLSTKAINIISNNKQTLNVSCSTLASAIRCKTSGAITNTEYTLTVRNLIGSIGSNNAAQTKEFQYQFKTNQVINVYNSSINPNNSSSDLLRSIDGVNWTNTLMNANYSNVFYMSNHNIIMTSDNGITISNNIFTTNVKYNNIKLPLLNSDISDSDIKINSWASDSDNVVVGVGGNTNSAVLVYSTDAGASWSEVKINNLSKPLVAIANGSMNQIDF